LARCICHIDLDTFLVSVEQVLNPKLKGKPVITGGYPKQRRVASNAGGGFFQRTGFLREDGIQHRSLPTQ